MHKTTIQGYIHSVAATPESNHPLQTHLKLILTDFEPNGNKQGVPLAEKANLIKTALNQPIKIHFDGDGFENHAGAIPIGPITHVYESEDNGRPVVAADAVIWNEIYEGIAEHLKAVFASGIGTSWEIYCESKQVDAAGVEWLQGVIFAGTCIVKTPAYGAERTRILAIAELLDKESFMTKPITKQQSDTQTQEMQQQLYDAESLLYELWNGLEGLYNKLYQIAQEEAVNDLGTIATSFADKLSKITEYIDQKQASLASAETQVAELQAAHTVVQAELDQLKTEKLQAEESAQRAEEERLLAEKKQTRKAALIEAGLTEEAYTAKEEVYLGMDDALFASLVETLGSVRANSKVQAEQKTPIIPEPLGNGHIDNGALAEQFRKEFINRG